MIVEDSWEFKSYLPLVKGVLDLYDPKFVLELGIGFYSTPLFIDREYMGVENDLEWIKAVKEKYGELNILHHDLGDIEQHIQVGDISDDDYQGIIYFYEKLEFPDTKPNLLFVDNYASCRALAVNILKDKFDLIIMHDSEPSSINNFGLLDKSAFIRYQFTTPKNWTELWVNKGRGSLYRAVKPHIDDFIRCYPEVGNMDLF